MVAIAYGDRTTPICLRCVPPSTRDGARVPALKKLGASLFLPGGVGGAQRASGALLVEVLVEPLVEVLVGPSLEGS